MSTKVRIGIDVGGTFTDAVLIDNATCEVIAKTKLLTTHHAPRGVAEGIIQAIGKLLSDYHIDPSDVVFIAHGTTQATNALLEGDVAHVGILGLGAGLEGKRAQNETQVGDIELAPGKYLHTCHTFLDASKCNESDIDAAIESLKQAGAEVIVASEAYSVDNPENEIYVVDRAKTSGIPATGGYEISQLYGLRARTRTACVNAALIPKMMDTANMTERSVQEAKIDKPLMIMRCDGGVMSVDEVRRRPILTMLSGLAAGVAGALMYEKITDGIFLEVGGTSVDISAIKDGKVMIRNAQVGGHKLYLTSLDVRTLGIAGGSMIVFRNNQIVDVGPRSAHIAELEYECFTDETALIDPCMECIAPRKDDSPDYLAVRCANGKYYALTLAGAANLLGYVPDGDYARGNVESTRRAWKPLADRLGLTVEDVCRKVMDIAAEKVGKVVTDLINEYQLNPNIIHLVGGGGSAAVLAPYLGEKLGIRSRIAKNAPYISTIGVAMAMVMERLERNVVKPTPEDIRKIRSDILEMVIKAGAKPDSVDITVEIDSQKNILRAVATGSTEMRVQDLGAGAKPVAQITSIVAESAGTAPESVTHLAQAGDWHAFSAQRISPAFFGLLKKKTNVLRITDSKGVIRLQKDDAKVICVPREQLAWKLSELVDRMTTYNDGGAMLPKTYLCFRTKMVDLSGVLTKEQLLSLLELELEFVEADEQVLAIAARG